MVSAAAKSRTALRRRPDPRVEQTRRLVLDATLELVSEVGFHGATVERIAERSGVARSSIYRHWPQPLPALHLEALVPVTARPEDVPPTGELRPDLLAYLVHVADRLNDPNYAAVSLALLAVADADVAYADAHRELLSNRTRILHQILRRAVRRGELCACTDVAFEARMVLSPMTHLRFVEHRAVERTLADRLITRLTEQCAPQGVHCRCASDRKATG